MKKYPARKSERGVGNNITPIIKGPRLAYSEPLRTQKDPYQFEFFMGLPRSEFTLEIWSGIFQVIKEGPRLLLILNVVKISKR